MKKKDLEEVLDLTNDETEAFVVAKMPVNLYRELVQRNIDTKKDEVSVRGSWTDLGKSFLFIF